MTKDIRIYKLDVKGWAGVDEVSIINPDPHVMEVFSQDNAEGKTSLLDAIKNALGGAKALEPGIVREGSERSEVLIDLGPCTVKCVVSESGRRLTVKTEDGKPIPQQQTYLNGLFGIMLAPTSFSAMDEKEQLALVRRIAGVEWTAELAHLDEEYKTAYDERHRLGQNLSALGSKPQPVEEMKAIDTADLSRQLDEADAHNKREHAKLETWKAEEDDKLREWERECASQREAWRHKQYELVGKRHDLLIQMEHAKARVESLRAQLAQAEKDCEDIGERFDALPAVGDKPPVDPPKPAPSPEPETTFRDTYELRRALGAAGETNRKAHEYERYLERTAAWERAHEEHKAAETAVTEAMERRKRHEASVKLPSDLSLSTDGLRYKRRPLARMSCGEGVDLAFDIATQLQQRILLLDNAEAFGPKTIAHIAECAVERKCQVVMATRGKPHTSGAYELSGGRLVVK